MQELLSILDLLIVGSAFMSAWFWWLASRRRMRRVSRNEELNYADINRIVTALNRTQILNSRAALATACMAAITAIRIGIDVLVRA